MAAYPHLPSQSKHRAALRLRIRVTGCNKKEISAVLAMLFPDAINGNIPANALLESRKRPAPPKLSANVTKYPLPANRNVIANEVYAATAAVWNEVKNDEADLDFLRKCYVEPEASTVVLMLAEELVRQRLSVDEAQNAQALQLGDVPSIIGEDLPEKPVVVLGKVGHGKTTFLRYLREVKARSALANYIQLSTLLIVQIGLKMLGNSYMMKSRSNSLRTTRPTLLRTISFAASCTSKLSDSSDHTKDGNTPKVLTTIRRLSANLFRRFAAIAMFILARYLRI